MNSRLALYTTAYPEARRFLRAWYESACRQTDLDFDIWMGVDSLTSAELSAAVGRESPPVRKLYFRNATPAQIRQHSLEMLCARYEGIVLTDSDDMLFPTRIEAAREMLEASDLAGCALRIVDSAGRDTGVTFGPGQDDDPVSMLDRYNVFGLSNTAYRSESLRRLLPVPHDCVLIDWLLATRAWMAGARFSFDRTERMAYRQYGANTARVLGPFSTADVCSATSRAMAHYDCLLYEPRSAPEPFRSALVTARTRLVEFRRATADPETLSRYVERLNALPRKYVWWWIVARPELEEIWKPSKSLAAR